jgi:undecaprenyl-diphosphatase
VPTASIDFTLYRDAYDLYGNSVADDIMRFCANDLIFVMVAIVAALFLVPWRRRRLERRTGAVTATLALPIALLIGKLISDAVDRTRPFVAHHLRPHIHHAADASFPSDHTTAAFALAVAVFVYDRTIGAILLVAGVLIGFARVFEGVHYPSDVLGGAVLGAAVALALGLIPAARRLLAALAARCSRLWDRVLGVVVRPQPRPS